MLTVFIVGAVICGYLAVALAVYILLLRFTDIDSGDCACMGPLWPLFLLCVVLSAVIWAVVHIISSFIDSLREGFT